MPNIVQNAVGTQRQFTKQPVATYQKRLGNLTAREGIVNTGAGDRLYHALTGLGDAVMAYAIGEEDRKKAKVVQVNKIINSMSDEDMNKLKAIDLLNKYNLGHLADNPYAVAALEQGRGRYLAQKFNQEYDMLAIQEPLKDEKEEAERYMREKRKFLEEHKDVSHNLEGFYNGFWETNFEDVERITDAKVAERSREYAAIRDGELTGNIEKIAYAYSIADKQDPEALFNEFQAWANEARVTNLPTDKLANMLMIGVERIAKLTGSLDTVNRLCKLVVGTKDNGEEIHLEDIRPPDAARAIADQTQLAKPNEYTQNIRLKMMDCKTPEELKTLKESLPKEVQNRMSSEFANRELQMHEEQIQMSQSRVRGYKNQQDYSMALRQNEGSFKAYMAGMADGTSRVSADMADVIVRNYLMSPEFTTLPADQRSRMFAKALMWGPNRMMQNDYKQAYANALASMTPDEMADPGNLRSITTCRSLWNANPGRFAAIFGKDLSSQMQVMQSLIDAQGDEMSGYELYCTGRAAMQRDPTSTEVWKEQAKYLIQNNGIQENEDTGFQILDAQTGEYEVGNFTDPILRDSAKNTYLYLLASGQSSEAALETLSYTLQKNYVTYDGNIIPRVVFAELQRDEDGNTTAPGIDAKETVANAVEFMDAFRIQKGAAAKAPCTWAWNPTAGTMELRFTNGIIESYTLEEFWDKSNSWHYDPNNYNSDTYTKAEGDMSQLTATGSRRATYGGPSEEGWQR